MIWLYNRLQFVRIEFNYLIDDLFLKCCAYAISNTAVQYSKGIEESPIFIKEYSRVLNNLIRLFRISRPRKVDGKTKIIP